MKTKMFLMFALVMVIASAAAFAGDAVQMWKCEMDDDATEAEIKESAQKWLAAAKKVKGGENLEASVYFPVAVNATGETDLWFVVTTPSFEEWGRFWDNYEGSEASKVENANNDHVICPDSAVWERVKVK